jgi:hypothetical protein
MELGHLKLRDGTVISVQASKVHYSTPRENGAEKYSHVEVASWGAKVLPELSDLAEGGDYPREEGEIAVYPYTPVERVEQLITARGGVAEHLGKRVLFWEP